jgi:deoxyguanosine kinase
VIVAFEGLPGAGKTSTAQLLSADLDAKCVIESTHNHPFLESVYRDDARHDLQIELAFLLLHASAWRAIDPAALTVTDFTPVKDMLFAHDTLTDPADMDLFARAYVRLHDGTVPADIVIYLDATPELALARVRHRYEQDYHRRFEQTLELERLRRIEHQYQQHRRGSGGDGWLTLDLQEVLRPGEDEQQSKRTVARAAAALIEQNTT